jgi:GNAT superfamily N-acetyltransferase
LRQTLDDNDRPFAGACTLTSPADPSPIEVTIHIATRADRDDVLRLLALQFAEHDIFLEAARLEHVVDGQLDTPRNGRILVARLDGRVVGIAALSFIWTLEHGGMSCWLDELYVEPALRSHRIGTKLIHAAMECAAKDGCIAMDLEVEASHSRAANLYLREGFTAHARSRFVRMLR